MKPSRSYEDYLLKSLKNPEEAAGYLNAVLEDGDYRLFLIALRQVAKANGGMFHLSKKTKLSRPNLYRMLSKTGQPEIHSLTKILESFGLILTISPKNSKGSHPRKAA